MRLNRKPTALILVLLIILGGCCIPKEYEGDGQFTDSCETGNWALWSLDGRYELNLGKIDLSINKRYEYKIGKLPKAEMWIVGLDIMPLQDYKLTDDLCDAVVTIEMSTLDGHLVIDESAPLRKWAWMTDGEPSECEGPAFVYRVGNTLEIPMNDQGGVRVKGVDFKTDEGWGTYFSPLSEGYDIHIEVITPDPGAVQYQIELHIEGSNYIGSL